MDKLHFGLVAACMAAMVACATAARVPTVRSSLAKDRDAIRAVLDDWHAAAAASDEPRYFAHLCDDAIFLGTDATERWSKTEFRAYAKGPFSKGRGWSFVARRRDVVVEGKLAWFDEDLTTPNLGPARGSGVLRKNAAGRWHIVHYNLAITVPNDQFAAVRDLLATPR